MIQAIDREIKSRLRLDNLWWQAGAGIDAECRDLPSLYGISDIQELSSLFNTLAYNTGRELGLEDLSRTSHVAKNTLIRYLEYLDKNTFERGRSARQ
ncbi:MAG: hypothetical protein A3G24_23120 [Betaproteobacteria bacterium RIFCSPLOWO2_12_FULL_62_13]|nr:MAG: hypothetical protein A3G24_23120 [Betaproteobacteria bacterium RIFCSPLOWO2_12_FULL_62_13]